jgi:hypothetical protein
MADDNTDLMAEFQEFLNAKKEKESAEKEAEDFEVEIWDEKGRGVRTRRSHAKPFLQSLGIDTDPEPNADDKGDNDDGKGDKKPSGPRKNAAGSQSVTRKYFVKNPAGK